jgi:hypothetical protein
MAKTFHFKASLLPSCLLLRKKTIDGDRRMVFPNAENVTSELVQTTTVFLHGNGIIAQRRTIMRDSATVCTVPIRPLEIDMGCCCVGTIIEQPRLRVRSAAVSPFWAPIWRPQFQL